MVLVAIEYGIEKNTLYPLLIVLLMQRVERIMFNISTQQTELCNTLKH